MLLFVKSNLFLVLFSFVESLFRIIQFGPFVMTEITKSFASKYQNDDPKSPFRYGPYHMAKVGCVFPTVVVAKLLHAKFEPNRKDALHFTKLTYLSPFVHQGAQFRYHKTNRFLNNGKRSSRPENKFTFNRIINIAIRIIQSEKFFNQHVITIFIFTFPIQNITTLIHHNISTVCLSSFQNSCYNSYCMNSSQMLAVRALRMNDIKRSFYVLVDFRKMTF